MPTNLFAEHTNRRSHKIVGLMSGTSVDGVDAALVELLGHGQNTQWTLLRHTQYPFPADLQRAVLDVSVGQSAQAALQTAFPAGQLARLDAWMGEVFAAAALECIRDAGIAPRDVDAVASHGQTVCHLPDAVLLGGNDVRSTLQLGSGAVIAARTGLPVLCDFRSADLALGGQGAPLAPFADWVLFAKAVTVRVVQNLGGIGNLTYLPNTEFAGVRAFDTGPANMLVDGAVQQISGGQERFDRDGARAQRGSVSTPLLTHLLDHPFLHRQPPKSTGREDFGESYLTGVMNRAQQLRLSEDDLVATLTAVGPESAARAYRHFLPQFPEEIILGGGGSLNPIIVDHFRRLCPGTAVRTHEEFGIPAQAKEALAFAILANETLHGNPSNVPTATGASGPAVLGCLYPPPHHGSV